MSHILSLRGTGQPIAYFPKLGKYIGCVKAGIFLGQMVFWSDKTDNPLGVYKTSEQIEEETGLSYREQVSARKKLVALGLISETYKRLDHRLYFKFNEECFDNWLSEVILANVQSVSSPTDESAVREQTKAQFVTTENTTKNTTDINTHNNAQTEIQNPDSWKPNLDQLANALRTTKYSQRVSEILGMEDFQFHLGNFNVHHEKNHQISDNQKLRKFAQWIFQEFEKQMAKAERDERKTKGYGTEKQNSNLDVNTAWINQASQNHAPVTTSVDIPEDFA